MRCFPSASEWLSSFSLETFPLLRRASISASTLQPYFSILRFSEPALPRVGVGVRHSLIAPSPFSETALPLGLQLAISVFAVALASQLSQLLFWPWPL